MAGQVQVITGPFAIIRSVHNAFRNAAVEAHLVLHLHKEEQQLYPVLQDRTTVEEQGKIVASMGSETPEELFPEAVRFFFTFAGHDDQATIIRGWMHAFPPAMFSGRAVPLIRETVKDDWAELVQRVPELSEAAPGAAQLAETFR